MEEDKCDAFPQHPPPLPPPAEPPLLAQPEAATTPANVEGACNHAVLPPSQQQASAEDIGRHTALPTEPPQLDLLGAVASGEEAGMHVALSAEPPLLEQPPTVTSFASVEGAEGHAALLAEPPQLDLPGAVANGEEDRPSIPPWLEWGSLIEFGQLPKPV